VTELFQALEDEVAQFRAWADAVPIAERSGEWECDYTDWQGLYSAFIAFVRATPCQRWNEDADQMLLYAIARDNEMEALVKKVARNPDNLICLAERAVVSPERDAKWQLAVELGRLAYRPQQVELLLLEFAHDEDEYVRRRALLALADIGSPKVKEVIESAWETGDEYQRIAVQYALWKIGSQQLDTYLGRADADGRQYLVSYAARIRTGNPE
jgi:HEAT repeat protein